MVRDIQNVEDAEAVVIGERYKVTCVGIRSEVPFIGGIVFPILGDWHDDAEFLTAPVPHVHLDFRFIPAACYADMIQWARDEYVGFVRSYPSVTTLNLDNPSLHLATV